MKRVIFPVLLALGVAANGISQGLEFTAEPENLGPGVNTKYADFKPVVSPDGKTLYILRRDYPQNVGGGSDDIWVSHYVDGKWQTAYNIGSPLNNAGVNSVSSITPDDNSVLLMSVYNYFDGSMSNGVSISHRSRGGWTFPKKQTIEKWLNLNDHVGYYLTNDNSILLSSAETKKKTNFGGMDLYFSKRTGENEWSQPVNMGDVINTSGDEFGMFLAADGKTLYFASDGLEGGYGSSDVWKSTRLDDTWTNWSKPVNLGPKINSSDWEAYFTIPASGDYAYFVSEKNAIGEEDIYRIEMPKEAKPEPVVLVSGSVKDAKTGEPVQAQIVYEILPGGAQAGMARSEPKEGKYRIVLPYGKKYGFTAVADNYYAIHQNLDVSELTEYKEIEQDILLAPIEVGEVVRLNNIFFETGKSTLLDESFPELDRVVKLMTDNATMKIEISGHTDSVGEDADNLTLSQARAQAVVDYLTSKGVKKNRLTAQGYGETKPVATNDTDEGKQLNRRVEFKILSS